MSIIDQDVIDAAGATFEIKFQEIFEHDNETPSITDRIAEIVPTESVSNEVDVLGAMPVLRKWVGAKQEQTQRAYNQTATLETYEATFGLDRKRVAYDKLGIVGRRIEQFMRRNKYWKEKILFDFLVTNPTGYDDVAMFSASHPHGPNGATQSNTVAAALAVGTLDAAITAQSSLQDEKGESLGLVSDLLVVGPKNRKVALELTGSHRLQNVTAAGALDATASAVAAASIPSIYSGGVIDVLVWPRLVGTYDDYWYVFASGEEAKALLLYEGRDVEGIPQTDMNGEHRFINDRLRWSLESDHAPAAGAWQTAYAGIL